MKPNDRRDDVVRSPLGQGRNEPAEEEVKETRDAGTSGMPYRIDTEVSDDVGSLGAFGRNHARDSEADLKAGVSQPGQPLKR